MTGALVPRPPRVVAAGAVHLPGWLPPPARTRLVESCRRWAQGPVPMEHHSTRGGRMSVAMASLGWYWRPYRYSATHPDGTPVAALPEWLAALARSALADAAPLDADLAEAPADPGFDVALINHYPPGATMGMHADRDERAAAPVVSFSLGEACVFRFGNTERRTRPYTDIELHGGDAFVFGGPARLAYHGVPRVLEGTADPEGDGPREGRVNITIRATGFDRN